MAKCLLLLLLYNTELVLTAGAIRQEVKRHTFWKKNKNTITYVENPKEFTKQQREQKSEFNKLTEYKVHVQK